MRKYISLLLVITLAVCVFFCGCKNEEEGSEESKKDYVVNNGGIINIGVIAPMSGDGSDVGNEFISGVKFANQLAEGIRIDDSYLINLIVCDLNDDIKTTCEKMINDKVAAVICAGYDYDNTNKVIDAFKDYSTPVIFMDNYSSKISSSSTAYSISVPYAYQNSIVSTYYSSQGYKKAAVICPEDSYSKEFAKAFKSVFEKSGGSVNVKHTASYDSEDFVFVIGNETFCMNTATEIRTQNSDVQIMLSETYDKNIFETDTLDDICLLSKLEFDVENNNNVNVDFMNVYSQEFDISVSDITSAVGYGYDAYVLVYGALAKFHPDSAGIGVNSSDDIETVSVNVSKINSYLSDHKFIGATGEIEFNDKGLVSTKYIYIDMVQNGKAAMQNRYVY